MNSEKEKIIINSLPFHACIKAIRLRISEGCYSPDDDVYDIIALMEQQDINKIIHDEFVLDYLINNMNLDENIMNTEIYDLNDDIYRYISNLVYKEIFKNTVPFEI